MRFPFPSRFIAVASLMVGPFVATSPAPTTTHLATPKDPRLVRLESYFEEKQCPVKHFAKDFVDAADRHQLDWRLLPSLAFVESTGGKSYRNNNIFGWANGGVRFKSVKSSIHIVAERLANSHYYRGKPLDRLLRTYNPVPGYAGRVMEVMEDLGPVHHKPLPSRALLHAKPALHQPVYAPNASPGN